MRLSAAGDPLKKLNVVVLGRFSASAFGQGAEALRWRQVKSWKTQRPVCARIEATSMGLDGRFVVTNLDKGSAAHVYAVIYCARGQAENLIKMHSSITGRSLAPDIPQDRDVRALRP